MSSQAAKEPLLLESQLSGSITQRGDRADPTAIAVPSHKPEVGPDIATPRDRQVAEILPLPSLAPDVSTTKLPVAFVETSDGVVSALPVPSDSEDAQDGETTMEKSPGKFRVAGSKSTRANSDCLATPS